MEERLFRCRDCKKIRIKRSEDQQYCGSGPCQKARNNAWRRAKYEVDPDYRANQQASTKAWLASQGGSAAYYRGYRKRRKEQQRKNQRRQEPQDKKQAANAEQATGQALTSAAAESANSNAKTPQSPVKSGRYRLSSCDTANSNAILVELSIIPES